MGTVPPRKSEAESGEAQGFALLPEKPKPRPPKYPDLGPILRYIDDLLANLMRSVQALEGRLTSEEQDAILSAMEEAVRRPTAVVAAAVADLEEVRARLEKAATLVGQACLRP